MTLEQALLFKTARKKAGLTQKQLAEKLGISVAPIYYIENASGSVAIGTVETVAATLGLEIQVRHQYQEPTLPSGKPSPEMGKKKI
jgi:transcriptional regulator with XRE-family HTH domain